MSRPGHNHTTKGNRGTLGDLISSMRTPATKNVEAAYSRAGASAHHTPAAATKLGSQDQIGASEQLGDGSRGLSGSSSALSFGPGGGSRKTADASEEPSAVGKFVKKMLNESK